MNEAIKQTLATEQGNNPTTIVEFKLGLLENKCCGLSSILSQ